MATLPPPWTLGQLAAILEGELCGPADFVISGPAPADADEPNGIAFAESDKFLAVAEASGVGALLVASGSECSKPHIKVSHPRRSFGILLHLAYRDLPAAPAIHPTAVVDPTAEVNPSAFVGAYAVIEAGAKISAGCRVYAHAYVGANCQLGEKTTIYPHAVLYRDITLGRECIVHSGAVLGADGFGYFWNGKEHERVPQAGAVVLGDRCEIGALTAIDRATAGATRLGNGVKVDNQVQIAHNVRIGDHTVMAAQVGLSGSAKIGSRVVLAGKVDVIDHASVADDVMMAGRTAVTQDVKEPGAYFGAPALPFREGMRIFLAQQKVPELINRIKDLEKRLKDLEDKV